MDVSVLQLINTLINWIICLIVLHFIRFIKAVIHINQIQGRCWNFVPLSKKNEWRGDQYDVKCKKRRAY